MKVRPDDPSRLSDFELLSFDCFGTLVDWDSGIYIELHPLIECLPSSHPLKHDRNGILKAFHSEEIKLCASKPGMKYDALLTETCINLASSLGLPAPSEAEAAKFGSSVGRWPVFPDTVKALQQLSKHYKLVILSNVDNQSFSQTLAGPLKDVKFDAVYTAEDIGSYKPDLNNFYYLLQHLKDDFGIEKKQVLHTGHGLKPDHVPAKTLGMTSAWIARGDAEGGPGTQLEEVLSQNKVAFTWQFETMGDMAAAADADFSGR